MRFYTQWQPKKMEYEYGKKFSKKMTFYFLNEGSGSVPSQQTENTGSDEDFSGAGGVPFISGRLFLSASLHPPRCITVPSDGIPWSAITGTSP